MGVGGFTSYLMGIDFSRTQYCAYVETDKYLGVGELIDRWVIAQ